MRDILEGAAIHIGDGSPPFIGAVVVENGRISWVGESQGSGSGPATDATGLVVSPGFVDEHTHSDVSLLASPGAESALSQGITTVAVGLCGMSAAPLNDETAASLFADEVFFDFPGVALNWRGFGEYRARLHEARPAINIVPFAGHGALRRLVAGATSHSNTSMTKQVVRELETAIDQGARGFSTGLNYLPGRFASTKELEACLRAAARRGVPHHIHMRYPNLLQPGDVSASLAEAVRLATAADEMTVISHLYPMLSDREDEAHRLIGEVETAVASGALEGFDCTVFPRGATTILQQLPGWFQEGGMPAIARRVRTASLRRKLIRDLDGRDTTPQRIEWNDWIVVRINHERNASWLGHSVGELASVDGVHPAEKALDMIKDDGQFGVAATMKRQADLDLLLAHPLCVPISDGWVSSDAKDHRGLLAKSFGTFPHFISRYVRDTGALSLASAIRQVTSVPARRLRLADRGLVAAGYIADLVVFDPLTIANRATDANPSMTPRGIRAVMVNGEWAMRGGLVTGSRSGQVL